MALLVSVWTFNANGQTTLFDGTFLVGAGATELDGYGAVHSIIVQSTGTILVGGWFDAISGNSHSNLARLNSDGSYDGSFAGGTEGRVNALLQQPDGKILVAGEFTNLQGIVRQRIGRLLADGQIDPEFDGGSLLETERPAITLAVQPDGKVLLATVAGPAPAARLFRLHATERWMSPSSKPISFWIGKFTRSMCGPTERSWLAAGSVPQAGTVHPRWFDCTPMDT